MPRFILLAALLLTQQLAVAQQSIAFTVQQNTPVQASLVNNELQISIGGRDEQRQSFKLDIPASAHLALRQAGQGHSPYVEVWHRDEGMGTYTLHYLYAYQPATQSFVERHPSCGDVFINLRALKGAAGWVYSYFDVKTNRWKQCGERIV